MQDKDTKKVRPTKKALINDIIAKGVEPKIASQSHQKNHAVLAYGHVTVRRQSSPLVKMASSKRASHKVSVSRRTAVKPNKIQLAFVLFPSQVSFLSNG